MAFSLVQSASNTATTGTTLTVTLGSGTTAGNCLVVYVDAAQGTTNPTVSGITLGGVADHFAVAKAQNATFAADCEIWTDQNCAGGQTSVVISFNAGSGGSQGMQAWVEEWSGVALSGAVDKTSGASDTTGTATSWSSGSSGTLSQASELVVGAVGQPGGSGTTITGPSSPWTNQAQINSGTNSGLLAGHEVVSATTAQTYNGTFNVGDAYSAVIVTLKAPAAAVQGTVRSQQSKGRQSAAQGRARTARAQPAVPVVSQSRARGRASAQPGTSRARAARPVPAVPVQVRVRPAGGVARPGRVTVVRSTGAGVVPPVAAKVPPPGRPDDKPHLKKLLLLLE